MVQELRWIMLSKHEVVTALEAHNRMTPNFMPPGTITAWEDIDQTSIKVTMTTVSGLKTLFLGTDKLLQPLIRFCIENNIMLPLDGHKSVMVGNSNISLCIALEINAVFIDKSFPARLHQFAFV